MNKLGIMVLLLELKLYLRLLTQLNKQAMLHLRQTKRRKAMRRNRKPRLTLMLKVKEKIREPLTIWHRLSLMPSSE